MKFVVPLQCVFHSIRFKVNKVGVRRYTIFFALTAAVNAHPLHFGHRIGHGLPFSASGQNISRRYMQIL